ncbi:MAG: hypothetical protein A2Y40_08520 [Candidatus Margulisbacteria bacterium GWF2_35_9]|nr:MAG: hypothetical protein A2Y40_08520 [Candidatus Margulisbacteria bacterium GWF2_35_9]
MINNSFRRYYLDQFLLGTEFYGNVLDLGGKKEQKRGGFHPPLGKVISWEYLNTDKSTNPDYLCNAESIPVSDSKFDIVLMTEVLEHLENPRVVLTEVFRILKPGGKLVITVPFLYPIHSDPNDYQRWTPTKIKKELLLIGLKIEMIQAMGGIISVVMDLVLSKTNSGNSLKDKFVRKYIKLISGLLLKIDKKTKDKDKITTGFSIVAYKNDKIVNGL